LRRSSRFPFFGLLRKDTPDKPSNPVTEPIPVGQTAVMWRRAVPRTAIDSYLDFEAESDDELTDAWNYVSVYRWATDDEMIRYELEGDTLLVVSVMSNLELARYIDAD
jgi:hypothetical protein